MRSGADKRAVTFHEWFVAAVTGGLLAVVVWWGLVNNGGLVGGDTYPYFFPQKLVIAESFRQGQLPLWHHLTGLGYPLLAESQSAVFYPTTQILYRLTDINTAYNINILVHYWLAFLFAWRFARCQAVGHAAALLAAMVFVYGWLPARISLEWSCVGGMWFPLCLWLTDRLLSLPSLRRAAILTLCLGVQLLAGHFTLAFITQLTILGYAVLWRPAEVDGIAAGIRRSFVRQTGVIAACVFGALLVAGVQLTATAELKRQSQRNETGDHFNPEYGHLPPLYISQVFASWWYWHTPEVKNSGAMQRLPLSVKADTNAVEAHLYWGMLPLILLLQLARRKVRQNIPKDLMRTWVWLSVLALVYATGWLLPVTRHLPGFSYFMGPGRYTIIASLGGSLLAAAVLETWLASVSSRRSALMILTIAAVTLPDLLASGRGVADAVVVSTPPVLRLNDSWVRRHFETSVSGPARLLAPGPNVCNLYGVSCVPQYLGLGPAVYYSDRLRPRLPERDDSKLYPDAATQQQLLQSGITHILTLDAIANPSGDIELVGSYPDAFLNAVWGRGAQPVWLYRLQHPRGRVYSEPSGAIQTTDWHIHTPMVSEFEVAVTAPCRLICADLNYPGWKASVDGQPVSDSVDSESLFRVVSLDEGTHVVRWSFQPASFVPAAVASIVCLLILLVAMIFGGRRPARG